MPLTTLRVLLGFLKAGRVLDHGSSVLLLGALVLAPTSPPLLLFAAVALALLEKYLAWRVALDAEFFALLLEQPAQAEAFDAALAQFLGRPVPTTLRTMESRWRGARRLLGWQAGALAAQVAAVLGLLALAGR